MLSSYRWNIEHDVVMEGNSLFKIKLSSARSMKVIPIIVITTTTW